MQTKACQIVAHVRRRNGKPKWWCTVHRTSAWDVNGEKLITCLSADVLLPTTEDILLLNIDDYPGGVALWGALPAVHDTTKYPTDHGIHVHARREVGGTKLIDNTFPEVHLSMPSQLGSQVIAIHAEAALAYVASSIFGRQMKALPCSHCGALHVDSDFYAVNYHKKHQCNSCGREFFDKERSIGNPLMLVKEACGDAVVNRHTKVISRPLQLRQRDFSGGIRIWASNPAVLWTAPVEEEAGIHVHGYDHTHEIPVVDNTFSAVEIDGIQLNPLEVRYYMAQRELPFIRSALRDIRCSYCGVAHFDHELDFAIRPHHTHLCAHCGREFEVSGPPTIGNPFVGALATLSTAYGVS